MNYNLTIPDLNKYLTEIFELQDKVLDKELKLIRLQFELDVTKDLVETLKKYYVKGDLT